MPSHVAFLGPPGTYAHLVAEKRYGRDPRMSPLATIREVCDFVALNPARHGIIPIENSSGGAIYETVDILLAGHPRIRIREELALNVKLALLGHRDRRIAVLYSHFVPLEHCETWIRRHLPDAEKKIEASTALAAQRAAADPSAAALGSRRLARIYGLDVLQYPVEADIPNLTVFLSIGGQRSVQPRSSKMTIAVRLPNRPGSLCTLLESFRDHHVNLSRLISRPIRGCPREYAFLLDIQGAPGAASVQAALRRARSVSVEFRIVGAFPCRRPYQS